MSENNPIAPDVQTSSSEVFAYFAIPVETFQSIVDQQSVSGVSTIADNLVIKTLTDDDVFTVGDVSR